MKTLHKRCAGLDVHKMQVVACLRVANRGKASYELRHFPTTTRTLIELGDWLEQAGCTHVAMEATGVYWKPVWYILEGRFQQPMRPTSRPCGEVWSFGCAGTMNCMQQSVAVREGGSN